VNGWRVVSIAKDPLPLVRRPMPSQRALPLKAAAPKSSGTVNSPLLTAVAAFVSGPAIRLPPVGAS